MAQLLLRICDRCLKDFDKNTDAELFEFCIDGKLIAEFDVCEVHGLELTEYRESLVALIDQYGLPRMSEQVRSTLVSSPPPMRGRNARDRSRIQNQQYMEAARAIKLPPKDLSCRFPQCSKLPPFTSWNGLVSHATKRHRDELDECPYPTCVIRPYRLDIHFQGNHAHAFPRWWAEQQKQRQRQLELTAS